MEVDYPVYHICDGYGIYYGYYRKQMASYGGLGLQQSAFSIIRADLSSVYGHFLRAVRHGYFPWRLSFSLAVR